MLIVYSLVTAIVLFVVIGFIIVGKLDSSIIDKYFKYYPITFFIILYISYSLFLNAIVYKTVDFVIAEKGILFKDTVYLYEYTTIGSEYVGFTNTTIYGTDKDSRKTINVVIE